MSETVYHQILSSFAALAGLPDQADMREAGALCCDGVDFQIAYSEQFTTPVIAVFCHLGPPAASDAEARYHWMLQLNYMLLMADGPQLALDTLGSEYLVAAWPLDSVTPELLLSSVRTCVTAAKAWRSGSLLPDFGAKEPEASRFNTSAIDHGAQAKQQELLRMLAERN